MEFLRLGSRIPGSYWGTCSVDVAQFFKVDPDTKASCQLVSGDGGQSLGDKYCGPTYRDIFWQRYRIGTFSSGDMPNHAVFAVLTTWQIEGDFGRKWLAILREAGFEYIRSWNNSVGSPKNVVATPETNGSGNDSHLFALFRNIGGKSMKDQYTPPKAWTDLPKVKTEAWEYVPADERVNLTKKQFDDDLVIWNRVGEAKFLTEAELEKAGAPVILAGIKSENMQEPKAIRQARQERKAAANVVTGPAATAFPAPTPQVAG